MIAPINRAMPVLVAAAAREVGIPADRILGKDRHAPVALARQIAMTAARRHGYALPAIGEAFGRSHTTVMYATREVAVRAAVDPQVAQMLDTVADSLTDAILDYLPDDDEVADDGDGDERADALVDALVRVAAERDLLAVDVDGLRAQVDHLRRQRDRALEHLDAAQRDGDERRKAARRQGKAAGVAAERRRLKHRHEDLRAREVAARKTLRALVAAPVPPPPSVTVGTYETPRGARRVALSFPPGRERLLLDTPITGTDTRVIERFGATARLSAIAVVADGYLDEAQAAGRPLARERP